MRSLIPAILWALLILGLCSIPGYDLPHISFLELLSFDKFVHASLFFVLQVLIVRGLLVEGYKGAKLNALLFCIFYGGVLEVMQGTLFVERSADLYDFIANSFGAIMGLVFFDRVRKMTAKYLFKTF